MVWYGMFTKYFGMDNKYVDYVALSGLQTANHGLKNYTYPLLRCVRKKNQTYIHSFVLLILISKDRDYKGLPHLYWPRP